MITKYEEDGMIVIDFEDGSKIKIRKPNIQTPSIPEPTVQEQISEIKLTLDLLLLKQEGIL